MTRDEHQQRKARLLEQLESERARFESVWARLDEQQMTGVPVRDDGWTVKDLIAHITAWEQECLSWLETAARGEPPDLPAPGTWGPVMDAFTARAYEANRARPLAKVLADSRQVFERLLAALRALPDDPEDEYWSVWQDDEPPWGLLETFPPHYSDHLTPILTWLDGMT